MDIINILKQIGLTENESKTYIELLKIGQTTRTLLLKQTGVSSSKIYEILDRLSKKGLVSITIKNNVQNFEAAAPEKLKYFLEEKQKDIEKQKEEINKILPNLNLLISEKTDIFSTKIYEGDEGFKTALLELLKNTTKKSEYVALGIIQSKKESYNRTLKHWNNKRSSLGIPARLIYSEVQKKDYYNKLKKIPLTKIKKLNLTTPSALAIIDDKLLIIDFSDKARCVLITNKNIANSFKQFFESLWMIAK